MANYDDPNVHWDDPGLRYADSPSTPPTNIMNQNKVSAVLAATAVTNITGAIAIIRANLPFLVNLSEAERQNMIKAGDASAGFIQSSLLFAAQHPEALLAGFSAVEYAKDGALLAPYSSIYGLISQLNTDCTDTLMALNSDLMGESLDVYAGARANNRGGNYSSYVDTAKAHFAKGPRKPKTPPTGPTTPPTA